MIFLLSNILYILSPIIFYYFMIYIDRWEGKIKKDWIIRKGVWIALFVIIILVLWTIQTLLLFSIGGMYIPLIFVDVLLWLIVLIVV